MKPWPSIWPSVRDAVLISATKAEAVGRAEVIRGEPTTWDALARAWRRQGEVVPIGAALGRVQMPRPGMPGRKHLVIPDTQTKPGVSLQHFKWIGRYIVDKRPNVVIHLGDHWDLPSLSTYESPKKKASLGRVKKADIDAGNRALEILEEELVKGNFQPEEKYLLEGNHDGFAAEGRVGRYLAENPEDEGLITPRDFADSWTGWERVPFLEQLEVDGVLYSHLFPFSAKGRVSAYGLRQGASSARVQVTAMMQSCTAGHRQGLETAIHHTPRRTYRGIIAGSCYLHDEEYMGPGNRHWRGILVKHDVRLDNPNHYDLMEVSLEFLKRRYS